jgi:hypothetical protein
LAYDKFADWCVHGCLNCLIYMNDSDAFRMEHNRKVTFFDCHQRFIPMSHTFRGDKQSFLKGEIVRKGTPKQKLGVDIAKMLMTLRSQKMVGSKVTVKSTTGLIKVIFGNSLMQRH